MKQIRNSQSGVALLGALAVLAIASLLAYAMLDAGRLSTQQSAGTTRSAQAQLLSEGLYDYALVALAQDGANSALDSNSEAWAVALPDLPIERGFLSGRLRDLNGRLNVNALWRDGQRDAVVFRRFERLLINLELDPAIAGNLADAIDPDSLSQNGAEDPDYIPRNRRAPNRYLVDISELQHIVGVDSKTFALLSPHVSALPPDAALNINTASIPVLMSLSDGFSEELARRAWQDGQARYGNVSDFVVELDQAGLRLSPDAQKDLRVESRYFRALARVQLDGLDYFSQATLERSPGFLRVLQRRRGIF